jgi:small subunit ribosomal protein S17e
MNRIKRISTDLLEKHPSKFGVEFDGNKKAINELAIVRSKVLRNELAGYITSHLRREAAEEKASLSAAESEDSEISEEATEEE